MKPDAIICIRNGKSEIHQEKHRLEIDRWGKVTTEDNKHKIEPINLTENLSKISYELKIVPKNH